MILFVVSTSKNPPPEAAARCRATVEAARGPLESAGHTLLPHAFYDAALETPERKHWENLDRAIHPLDPATVVVSLDGDDWLATPDALLHVARAHEAGAWVTWGQFVYADGRPGFAAPILAAQWSRVRRDLPWVATHLKTFRAGLYQRIDPAHLHDAQGRWLEHARDMALMFPCLEMAGPERSRFIPEVLYVYNFVNSTDHNATPALREWERSDVRHVRALPPYARIEAL